MVCNGDSGLADDEPERCEFESCLVVDWVIMSQRWYEFESCLVMDSVMMSQNGLILKVVQCLVCT